MGVENSGGEIDENFWAQAAADRVDPGVGDDMGMLTLFPALLLFRTAYPAAVDALPPSFSPLLLSKYTDLFVFPSLRFPLHVLVPFLRDVCFFVPFCSSLVAVRSPLVPYVCPCLRLSLFSSPSLLPLYGTLLSPAPSPFF